MGYIAIKRQQPPEMKSPVEQPRQQAAPPPPPPQRKLDPGPPGSTNTMFGMRDVPPEERNKTMTQEEYMKKLEDGELLFGPVPAIPSIPALDDVLFDYCDGLRVYVPKAKDGEPIVKYHIFIKESEFNTIVCSADNDNSETRYICSIQKYYVHFALIVTRKVPLDQAMRDHIKSKYNLSDREIDYIHDLSLAPEIPYEALRNDVFSKFRVEERDKPRFAAACNEILAFNKAKNIFAHYFDPKDKEVMVQFPVGTIGDSIGWFSYMERFQQKTQCKLLCVMNPAIYCLFEKQYPNIKFLQANETKNYKPYASYNMGLFFKANTTNQPYDFRYIGNGRTVSKILDVDDTDIAPRADLSAPRKIKEPYVVIACQGSAYCKLWTHPQGWHTVIDHLRKIGYRIICIDKDKVTGSGVVTNHIPWGVEDDTGNKPLQERIDLLKDCDFFIGLSSGVSWIAWCAKCPVVMISGFTNPFNEYYTPYRVINPIFCHGCWNDETCDFDHYDYMWCPKHKNTVRAYECSKNITPEHVLNVIARIPAYQRMKAAYDEKHKFDIDPYLVAAQEMYKGDQQSEPVKTESVAQPEQPQQEAQEPSINIITTIPTSVKEPEHAVSADRPAEQQSTEQPAYRHW